MSMSPVHWHEGLFLQPHHLQRQARVVEQGRASDRAMSRPYPWGVLDLKLSTDALANGQVRLERLHAVTKGGIEVRVPETTDLPALDVRRWMAASPKAFTVCLALPVWQGARANTLEEGTADDPRIKRAYRTGEETVSDENTGENPQPVLVRRHNARLIVEGEDTSELDVLPLVRVARSVGAETSAARVELAYVPPCLTIAGSVGLRRRLRDLADFIETSRMEQALQLRSGWSIENLRGGQFGQLLRLMTFNRAASRLPALLASAEKGHGPTPLEMYLELRTLLGELVAFHPDRDPFDAPAYDHENLGEVFAELDQKVRGYSKFATGAVEKAVFKADDRDLVADLTGEQASKPKDYFLGIKTKMDTKQLCAFVEDGARFKMMSYTQRRLMIPGVKLEEERHPPMELGTPPGMHYFRLNRAESERMWEKIKGEKRVALVWPEIDRLEYEEVALYMTFA
jgi:type VI secretion system protein ImpJ